MSAVGFKGVSAGQDARFTNKEKKLLKTMKFPAEYQLKVDLPVIKWEAVKPWIAERTTELLGMEDEVLIAYIFEQLEGKQNVDPRELQISLTGFLEKNTSLFCKELWSMLASACANGTGVPQVLLDAKAAEVQKRAEAQKAIEERINAENAKRDEESRRRRDEDNKRRDAERRDAREQEHRRRDADRRGGRAVEEDRSRHDRDRNDRRDRDRPREADRDRPREVDRSGRDERERRDRDRALERPSERRRPASPGRRDDRKRLSDREARDSEAERARPRQRRSRSQSPAQKATEPGARELPPPPADVLSTDMEVEVHGSASGGKDAEQPAGNRDEEITAEPTEVLTDVDVEHGRLKAAKKAAKKEKKEKKRHKKEMKAEKKASNGHRAISEDGSDRSHSSGKGGSSDAEGQRKKVEDDLRKAALQSSSKAVE